MSECVNAKPDRRYSKLRSTLESAKVECGWCLENNANLAPFAYFCPYKDLWINSKEHL